MTSHRILPLPKADPSEVPAVTRPPLAVLIEPLLTVTDLADVLRTTRRSIERLRAAGRVPSPDLYLGKRQPRWRAETIRRFLDEQSKK
jgi:hypothetical protein